MATPPATVALRKGQSPVARACPSDDTLGAHIAGSLDREQRERLTAHLDDCSACRSIVVHAVRAGGTSHAHALAATEPAIADDILTPPFADRYDIKRELGRGGMGTVYEAIDLRLHRRVALKVLRFAPEQAEQPAEAANRLVREARAMAVLSHRNVVTVYDVGFHDKQVFVAMELVDGHTLRAWRHTAARTTTEILRILYEAGNGLAAAHAAGLVHRDFKPDNVLVSRHGTARVTDFGLARRASLAPNDRSSRPDLIDVEIAVTSAGMIVGTPAYMAPEQATGKPCDARADQFSFCVTAWEALYGNRPFAGNSWAEISAHVASGEIVAPPRSSKVPRSIQTALRRGLSAEPAARFPSMDPLLAVLRAASERPARRYVTLGLLAAVGAAAVILVKAPDDAQPIAVVPPVVIHAPPTAVVPSKPPPPPAEQPAKRTESPKPTHAPKRAKPARARVARVPREPAKSQAAAPDPRLVAIDGEWRRRGLLRSDLPPAFSRALADATAALAASDEAGAASAFEAARVALDNVHIDRQFVDRKLQRINEQLQTLPAPRAADYRSLLQEVLTFVKRGDYSAANRKLNAIVAELGVAS